MYISQIELPLMTADPQVKELADTLRCLSCDLKTGSVAANVLRLCVCLPLAQGFNLKTNFNGANSTKPLLCAGRFISTKFNLKTK